MDPVRHQRLGELFAQARSAGPAARGELLDRLRREDPGLAAELASLLDHHQAAPSTEDLPRVLPVAGALKAILASVRLQEDAEPAPGSEEGPEPNPREQSSIGRYRLLKRLGEGGMGVVYLAEQDHPRRTVALKIMRQGFGRAAASMRRRFELETQFLARLEHAGIARLYDAGTAPIEGGPPGATVPYFAMEHVDGKPLLQYAESNWLGVRDRMKLLLAVCRAVAAAHRQGVVHRDLKPGNILVDSEGQPKVLDFGVARAVGGDAAMTTAHTDIGQLVGTLAYMSPEQVSGDPARIDARTDVYALGVVAYELLSGTLPLPVRDLGVAEAARRIMDEEPAPLSSIDRSLRGDIDTIVAKAMEKDPQRRYQTADAFAEDIARWLEDEPIQARPASTIYQLRKFARRNRGLVAGVALAMVMLMAGLVATTLALIASTRSAEQARQARIVADAKRDAALEAEARATRRFSDLRKLAKTFIYDVHDAIVELPGSTEIRKQIVTTGLAYLDSLAAEANDDPRLQNELAEAYVKIGQAQGYYARGNLGDRAAALESFRKAAQIRETLVAARPDEAEWLIGLLSVQNFIGNIHYSEGRYDEALEIFEKVRARREMLVERFADDPEPRRQAERALFVAWQWIGNTQLQRKAHQEALDAYREQLSIARALHRPEDDATTRDLSVALEKFGDGLRALDRQEEALAQYRDSLRLRREISAAQPENIEPRNDLAVSLGRIARVLLATGELREAEDLFTQSRDVLAEIAEADPRDILAQTNLAIAEYRLGQVAAAKAKRGGSAEELAAIAAEGFARFDRALAILADLHRDGRLESRFVAGIQEISEARQAFAETVPPAERSEP